MTEAALVVPPTHRVCAGGPCREQRGRVSADYVQTLLDYLEGGETIDDFLEGFPTVTRQQVLAFLKEAKARMIAEVL